jgi:branched-chain amino acid transport system permease protein
MEAAYRKERLDRGIKVRSDDIFAIASLRDLAYLLLPRFLLIGGLLTLPLLEGLIGAYWVTVFLFVTMFALLAISWDFLSSVGLVSLGHSLFFGLGAYVSGALSSYLGWSPLFTIPIAMLVGSLLSTLILYPILSLRGIYFSLITLALPLMFMRVIEATKILGGTNGLSQLGELPELPLSLYIIIVVLLVFLFAYRRLIDSDYGLVLQAIKDNDQSVMAAGINVHWYKAQAVFLAALPATFAGAFITHHFRIVGMPSLSLEYSILPLSSAVVGGEGGLVGALVGALILVPLSELLRDFGTLRVVIYSLILVVFTVGLPEGIFHFIRRKYHQFERLVPVEHKK